MLGVTAVLSVVCGVGDEELDEFRA